jgi:hypothetical protein
MDTLDLARDGRHDIEIDAVAAITAKRFPAQLEQDAVVLRRTVTDLYVADQFLLKTP